MGKYDTALKDDATRERVKERVTNLMTFFNHDVETVGRWRSKQ